MITEIGGRKWELGDFLTGANGRDNLNAAAHGGVVSSNLSLGLFIQVMAMGYVDHTFTFKTYPGHPGFPVPANAQSAVWIDNTGNLNVTPTFPGSGFYVALAAVTTDLANVIQIINILQNSPSGAGGGVASVAGAAPVTSTGGMTPTIGIDPATPLLPGSMSAADKAKLNGIEALADVTDSANVDAAGALMRALFANRGGLAMGQASPLPPIQLTPGALGTFLMSQGPGADLIWNALSSFAPQIWIGNMIAISADIPLGANAYELSQFLTVGTIAIDPMSNKRIIVPMPGKYIGVMMALVNFGPGSITTKPRFPIGNVVAQSTWNPGPNTQTAPVITIFPFSLAPIDAPKSLIIEVASPVGVQGTAPENIIIIFKVSD